MYICLYTYISAPFLFPVPPSLGVSPLWPGKPSLSPLSAHPLQVLQGYAITKHSLLTSPDLRALFLLEIPSQ